MLHAAFGCMGREAALQEQAEGMRMGRKPGPKVPLLKPGRRPARARSATEMTGERPALPLGRDALRRRPNDLGVEALAMQPRPRRAALRRGRRSCAAPCLRGGRRAYRSRSATYIGLTESLHESRNVRVKCPKARNSRISSRADEEGIAGARGPSLVRAGRAEWTAKVVGQAAA